MPNLAANLSMLFTEYKFLDRFSAAAGHGFKGVEILFPYEWSANEIRHALNENNLKQVLLNTPPGDLASGDRGLGAVPGRESDFFSSLQLALEFAGTLMCKRIHVMAGIIEEEKDMQEARATFVENLKRAADAAEKYEVDLLIEPINNKRDIPGYFLSRISDARTIIEEVGKENVGLQLDLYHAQIMDGDLETLIRDNIDITRHYQIAGVPARHEPNLGEVNFPHLFEVIDSLDFDGWVGCEYRPVQTTSSGLDWAQPYGIQVQA